MYIVETKKQPNGAHRNQGGEFTSIPEGWAVIPETLETENFPFGEVEVKTINGVKTVTKWIPGIIPEPDPAPEPEPTEIERLRADIDFIAIMTGVEL